MKLAQEAKEATVHVAMATALEETATVHAAMMTADLADHVAMAATTADHADHATTK